jgi:competence protein ComEC
MATVGARTSTSVGLAPLAPVALSLCVGILIDRSATSLPCGDWASLALVLGLLAIVARGLTRRLAIIGCFIALGGAWGHVRWSALASDDLARVIDESPRPAWLRGVLVSIPEFHPPEFPDDMGHTSVDLAVTGLSDGSRWHRYSGTVRVLVGGDRTGLTMGQPVTVAGSLSAVKGPSNPGEYDVRSALRAEGIRLRMGVGEPQGIQPDPDGPTWPWTRWLGRARTWSQRRLAERLRPDVAPLATALVLGRRGQLDPDLGDAFARTGTSHLLAISGLHLQVLATTLFVVAQGVTSRRRAAFVVIVATALYASLVGWMPSVTRSVAMTLGACLAGLLDRGASPSNLLAAAAIATLGENPSNLFDVGCQLSFLAVAAILWGVPWVAWLARRYLPRVDINLAAWSIELRQPDEPLDALEARYAPPWRRAVGRVGSWLLAGLSVSLVVWVVTGPLVALRFHLVSPIGVLLNVPLVPLTSAALVLAGLALGLPGFLGCAAAWSAELLLDATGRLVNWGGNCKWGYSYTAGPSASWVLGYYVLLVLLLISGPTRRWIARTLVVWLALLPLLAALPGGPSDPEAEILDVGHGLSILIRPEPGRAVLYDCGRMRDPHVGRRLIARALWGRGVKRIDAVVLSHADADHYNGLPELLDRFHVRAVVVAPGFEDGREPARLLAGVRERGIPVRRVVAGDSWELGGQLRARVLHPGAGWPASVPDNDSSLVLDIERDGQHMLLTGDLDGIGLDALVAVPAPPRVDVLVAPHHGGRSANPPRLYDWARPGIVLVSQRPAEPGDSDPLGFLGGRAKVLRTGSEGALRIRWTANGLEVAGSPEQRPNETSRGERSWVRHVADRMPAVRPTVRVHHGRSAVAWLVGGLGAALGLGGFVLLAAVEWGAWSLVRPRATVAETLPEPAPWIPLTVHTPDGVRLDGAWRPGEGRRMALLLHGFGESRSAMLGRAEALARHGWGVLLADGRGRGASGGLWTTFGTLEAGDVRAWLDHLAERLGAGLMPVLWGRSMGAAIAVRVAAEDPRVAALILEAPYCDLNSSVATWLQLSRLPRWLAGPIVRRAGRIAGVPLDRPSPIELGHRVTVPVLIVHGADDRVAPRHEVERLASAFVTPPERLEVPGARHTDVFDVGGEPLAERIATFLDRATTGDHGRGSAPGAAAVDPS